MGDPNLCYKREADGICHKDQEAVKLSNNLKVESQVQKECRAV